MNAIEKAKKIIEIHEFVEKFVNENKPKFKSLFVSVKTHPAEQGKEIDGNFNIVFPECKKNFKFELIDYTAHRFFVGKDNFFDVNNVETIATYFNDDPYYIIRFNHFPFYMNSQRTQTEITLTFKDQIK